MACLEMPETPAATTARVYVGILDGDDTSPADRQVAGEFTSAHPELRVMFRQNRQFIARAVQQLAGLYGISQFIDLGCGLPVARDGVREPFVHEIAREAGADARVAYVDLDPMVVSHMERETRCHDGVVVIRKDLADTPGVLGHPRLRGLIDLDRPVAVLACMILHYFDAAAGRAVIAGYSAALAPGSAVVISVPQITRETEELRRHLMPCIPPYHRHPLAEVEGFFAGLSVARVGPVDRWPLGGTSGLNLGGVGLKVPVPCPREGAPAS